jgi:hypothetical protein
MREEPRRGAHDLARDRTRTHDLVQCRRARSRIEPEHHIGREHLPVFSVPRPRHIVAHLKLGSGPREKWYFFTPPAS